MSIFLVKSDKDDYDNKLFLVIWLSDECALSFFLQQEPLAEIINISNHRHTASRIYI